MAVCVGGETRSLRERSVTLRSTVRWLLCVCRQPGHTASGDPEAWSVVAGKLYVNYSQSVKKTWEQDVRGYITKAVANWPSVLDQ